MRTIEIHGAKGGQGASTIACSLALLLARDGHDTLLVSRDTDELAAVLGIPNGAPYECGIPNLTVGGDGGEDHDVIVRDVGSNPLAESDADERWLVIRNDYLALRRAMPMPKPDVVVAIVEPKRSLDARDVADVLGVTPIVLELDPAVGRAVDSGLLSVRMPASLRNAVTDAARLPLAKVAS